MKSSLVAFSLCACIASICSMVVHVAQNGDLFQGIALLPLNDTTKNELEKYSKNYFVYLTNATNYLSNAMTVNIKGIVCVFTVKLKEVSIIVLEFTDEHKKNIKGKNVQATPPVPNLIYEQSTPKPEICEGSAIWNHALSAGKTFIRHTLNMEPAVTSYRNQGANSAGYNYFVIHGNKDGKDDGDYMLFTVLYSKGPPY